LGDALYLGKYLDSNGNLKGKFQINLEDLLTHVFILGMTGSGKTVLGKCIVEEAALKGIPSIVIDIKGDLTSLALVPESPRFEHVAPIMKYFGFDPKDFSENAECYSLKPENYSYLRENVRFKVYTPFSSNGILLSLTSIPESPRDFRQMYSENPEYAINLVETVASSLLARLGRAGRREWKFLSEVIKEAWLNGLDLQGVEGLKLLIGMILNPPFEKIGAMDLESYYPLRDRKKLAIKINDLMVGSEAIMQVGEPLDIDSMIRTEDGKTVVAIINLTEAPSDVEMMFAVSRISYQLYRWMREKGGSRKPRLIFYIDELATGGKAGLLPPYPHNPPSKQILSLLLKQGRAFGLSCIYSTQNPGDVDYKALSNCGIWAIGRLTTDRDRKKALEGVSMIVSGEERQKLSEIIAGLQPGCFAVKLRSGKIRLIRERWLYSIHITIPPSKLSYFKPKSKKKMDRIIRRIEREEYEIKWYNTKEEIIGKFYSDRRRKIIGIFGVTEALSNIYVLKVPIAVYRLLYFEKAMVGILRKRLRIFEKKRYLLVDVHNGLVLHPGLGAFRIDNIISKLYGVPIKCLKTLKEICESGQARYSRLGRRCVERLEQAGLVYRYKPEGLRYYMVKPRVSIDIWAASIEKPPQVSRVERFGDVEYMLKELYDHEKVRRILEAILDVKVEYVKTVHLKMFVGAYVDEKGSTSVLPIHPYEGGEKIVSEMLSNIYIP